MAKYCYKLQSCDPTQYKDITNLCLETILGDIDKIVYINGDPSKLYRIVYVGADVCICDDVVPPYTVIDKECSQASPLRAFTIENCDTGETRDVYLAGEITIVGAVIEVNEVKGCWTIIRLIEIAKEIYTIKKIFGDCKECLTRQYFTLNNCVTGKRINVELSGNIVVGNVISVAENKECWTVTAIALDATVQWTLIQIYKDCVECAGISAGEYWELKNCATQEVVTAEVQGGAIAVGNTITVNENNNCYEVIGTSANATYLFTFNNIYYKCDECLSATTKYYRVQACYGNEINTVQILGGAVNVGDIITVYENNNGWIVLAEVQGGVDTWTYTGHLNDCSDCPEPSGDCKEDGERTIAYATMVRLPEPPIPDKGFKECCYTNLVLAHPTDSDKYKNDFTGFWFKKQTSSDDCNFILHELATGDTYDLNNGTYGVFKDFGSIAGQPNLTTYIVHWRKVLNTLGRGLYQIEKAMTVAGLPFSEMSNTFTLESFNDVIADKTVRIDAKMDGKLVHYDNVNFKGSGFETSIRTYGFFGRRDPKYKQDNLVKRNYETVQISMSQENEYEFQTGLIPECITVEIYDFILFGNELFISDYNAINHSYKYRLYEVELDSNKGGKYYTTNRDLRINLTFADRLKNKRKINC